MRRLTIAAAASVALSVCSLAASAQHAGHDMGGMDAMTLPAACGVGETPAMDMSAEMEGAGEHQRAYLEGMMATEGPMMQGVMADDADIGFACGMIAHHQAAINMSEVELEFGDDDAMKAMAQQIIDAQKAEIAELTAWIEAQSN